MMLAVENLDVLYGDAQALDDVSLQVEEGAIVPRFSAHLSTRVQDLFPPRFHRRRTRDRS